MTAVVELLSGDLDRVQQEGRQALAVGLPHAPLDRLDVDHQLVPADRAVPAATLEHLVHAGRDSLPVHPAVPGAVLPEPVLIDQCRGDRQVDAIPDPFVVGVGHSALA